MTLDTAGYTSPDYDDWINIYKTGHLLYMMALVGDTPATERVQRSLGFLRNHWMAPNSGRYGYPTTVNGYWDVGWRGGPVNGEVKNGVPDPLPSYIATVATMKALVALGLQRLGDIDWFNDFADVILANQTEGGWWEQGGYPPHYGPKLHTLWALLTILRAAPVDPIPAETTSLFGGGNCFIATAAFGSYQEPHVVILRQFRDRYLLTNGAGRAFVRFYYRYSPAAANLIAGNPAMRAVTRVLLLPAYGVAYLAVHVGRWIVAGLLCGLLAVLVAAAGRKRRCGILPVMLAVLLLSSSPALALDGNHFSPAFGEEVFIVVPGTATLPRGTRSAGLFLTYAEDPVKVTTGGQERSLSSHQAVAVAGFAAGLTERIQVGVKLPFLLDQGSDFTGAEKPYENGVGDIRVEGKFRVKDGSGCIGVALVPYVTLDTGSNKALFSKGTNAAGVLAVADRDFGKALLTFYAGFQRQGKEKIHDLTIENTMLFGAGLGMRFDEGRTAVTLEVYGRSDGSRLFDGTESTPIEALAGVRQNLSERIVLKAGGGAGLNNGYGAPDYRLFAGVEATF